MKKWEKALNKFLISWKSKKEVVGVVVCGSFLTDDQTKYSDIDIHIILKDGTKWREIGSEIVDGFIIEYFANSAKQVIEYFEEDYINRTRGNVVQFMEGKILFDDGTIEKLKNEANKWYKKEFPKQSRTSLELNKHYIWGMFGNLRESFEENLPDFWFLYHNYLNKLLQLYCNFIGYPEIREDKALNIFANKKIQKIYLLDDFPDDQFNYLIQKALVSSKKQHSLKLYKRLSSLVLIKMGGFQINGWRWRSKVLYKK